MTKRVRWLHLSDIHFRHKSRLDQNDAFARIRVDLAKRRAAGRGPDLIFVTGDITHSGQPADFLHVSTWLDQLCSQGALPRERVFFCPGNHDSDIQQAPMLIQGCWNSLRDVAAFQTFLTTPEYPALLERQAAYRAFVRAFRGDSGGFDPNELHAATHAFIGDLRVGILMINSALLAAGGPADHGRLQVCIRALEERRAELTKSDLVFALIHHPFEWLAPFEADRVEALVFESADVLLRGHLHQPKLTGSLRGGIVSAAGALWAEAAGDYEYSFGSLALDTLNCDIESVRYVQKTGHWLSGSESVTLQRSRDELFTPGAIRAELGHALKFPAQVACVLSGHTSELMMSVAGTAHYVSAERVVAESLKGETVQLPALAVIRIRTLLRFYGSPHIPNVIRDELGSLLAYDMALQAASTMDSDFAKGVNGREVAAAKLADEVVPQSPSWTLRLLARLVADGDALQILALRDDDGDSVLKVIKGALLAGSRDPYAAWRAAQGPDLDYSELATVATRLAIRPTADLAALALSDAAARFPTQARRLASLAKIIATELADPTFYAGFNKLIGRP